MSTQKKERKEKFKGISLEQKWKKRTEPEAYDGSKSGGKFMKTNNRLQRMKYIDYNGYRYWYEYKLAEDRVSICLATEDPLKYCNGLYLYSTKDPGDGMAFVVIATNDPDYSNLPLTP